MNAFKSENPAYIIAEIGGNHEGDFEYAKQLTQLALNSRADAIKFQIYTGDSLVNKLYDPKRVEHFKKFELSINQYKELAEICISAKKDFMASVWNKSSIEEFKDLMPIFKIGSGDLTAYDVIEHTVNTKKPIILSTGLSTYKEIDSSLKFIYSLDPDYEKEKKVALLQCTSMYPIPDKEANLNVILELKKLFDCPVGYSDHTEGTYAAELAIAMGAEIIEVHFTDNRKGKEFRDHKVSLTNEEIDNLVYKSLKIKELKGKTVKQPTDSEIESGHTKSFRRGLFLKEDLKKGARIERKHIISLRPKEGISASYYKDLIGKRITKDIKKLEKLSKDWFE